MDLIEPEQVEEAEDAAELAIEVVSLAKRWTEIAPAQSQMEEEERSIWAEDGIIEPVYPPSALIWLYRESSLLQPNISAIVHNVDGFGWTFEPTIDFEADDIKQQVAAALYLDEYSKWEEKESGPKPKLPSDEKVDKTINEWSQEAMLEKARLDQHFKNACFEMSYIGLRRAMRTDREIIGYAGQEVIRARHMGAPRRYLHAPAHQLRVTKLGKPVPVEERVKTSACTYGTVTVYRRFRKIVQRETEGGPKRYFRWFGDPRIMSSNTGRYYDSEKALETEAKKNGLEKGAKPANEIMFLGDYFPGSPYPAPRFHGAIPELRGAWLAANHTVDYLANNAIPRGLLLASGTKIQQGSIKSLRKFFRTKKGQAENRIALVQAESPRVAVGATSPAVKLEFVDLSGSQRDDASFLKYIEHVSRVVGQCFRLPEILRGGVRDLNRASAFAAMQFAEDQVFASDRMSYDWQVNHHLLPALGIRFWTYRSRGPSKQDPETMAKVAEIMLKQGVVAPAELRGCAERWLSIDLLRKAARWQQLPIALVMQGFTPDEQPGLTPEVIGTVEPAPPEDGSASKSLPSNDEVTKAAEEIGRRFAQNGGDVEALAKAYAASIRADQATVEDLFGDG